RRRAPTASALGWMPSAASISLLISGTFPNRVAGGHEQAPCHAAELRRYASGIEAFGTDREGGSARKRQEFAAERQAFAALAASAPSRGAETRTVVEATVTRGLACWGLRAPASRDTPSRPVRTRRARTSRAACPRPPRDTLAG